jgi:hypothetical protein
MRQRPTHDCARQGSRRYAIAFVSIAHLVYRSGSPPFVSFICLFVVLTHTLLLCFICLILSLSFPGRCPHPRSFRSRRARTSRRGTARARGRGGASALLHARQRERRHRQRRRTIPIVSRAFSVYVCLRLYKSFLLLVFELSMRNLVTARNNLCFCLSLTTSHIV